MTSSFSSQPIDLPNFITLFAIKSTGTSFPDADAFRRFFTLHMLQHPIGPAWICTFSAGALVVGDVDGSSSIAVAPSLRAPRYSPFRLLLPTTARPAAVSTSPPPPPFVSTIKTAALFWRRMGRQISYVASLSVIVVVTRIRRRLSRLSRRLNRRLFLRFLRFLLLLLLLLFSEASFFLLLLLLLLPLLLLLLLVQNTKLFNSFHLLSFHVKKILLLNI